MARHDLTEADDGKSLQVHAGDEIALDLPENPTTGYRWSLDAGGLTLLGDDYKPSGSAAGAAGRRCFSLRVPAGDHTLRAKVWRPWSGESSVTRRFTLVLRAR